MLYPKPEVDEMKDRDWKNLGLWVVCPRGCFRVKWGGGNRGYVKWL